MLKRIVARLGVAWCLVIVLLLVIAVGGYAAWQATKQSPDLTLTVAGTFEVLIDNADLGQVTEGQSVDISRVLTIQNLSTTDLETSSIQLVGAPDFVTLEPVSNRFITVGSQADANIVFHVVNAVAGEVPPFHIEVVANEVVG